MSKWILRVSKVDDLCCNEIEDFDCTWHDTELQIRGDLMMILTYHKIPNIWTVRSQQTANQTAPEGGVWSRRDCRDEHLQVLGQFQLFSFLFCFFSFSLFRPSVFWQGHDALIKKWRKCYSKFLLNTLLVWLSYNECFKYFVLLTVMKRTATWVTGIPGKLDQLGVLDIKQTSHITFQSSQYCIRHWLLVWVL